MDSPARRRAKVSPYPAQEPRLRPLISAENQTGAPLFRLLKHPLILELTRPERRRNAWAFFAMATRGLFAVGLPYYMGATIGLIAEGADQALVWRNAIIMFVLALLTGISQFWMRWLYISSSRRFEKRLRDRVFSHITSLSYSYFNRARTGDIMSRLTADVEAVRMGVGPGVMHLFQTGCMAVGALTVMLFSFWELTLIAAIPMVFIFLAIRSLMPRMHKASLGVQEQLSELSSLAQESFSGTRIIKAFAREGYEQDRFDREAQNYIDASMDLAMTRARMHVIIEGMAGFVSIFVLYYGGRAVVRGELELGPFVAFFGYFLMLVWPMIALGWTMALFQRAAVAMDRLENILDVKPEIPLTGMELKEVEGAWKIENLSFRFQDGDEDLFKNLSFEIPKGGSIAIVGPTASGKSTLVQLLGRLLDPDAKSIYLDGHDIRDLNPGSLRQSIAMVPQETFLFSDTLRSNIAYARPGASDLEVEAAAEAAQVLDAIKSFPRGFDEVIGERGVTLSGGQKQRVAIARALLHEAPTLIMDDCLSAVDTDTEERILAHLKLVMEGRSTIIVAHRLSSVMHCDEILVLKDGRIQERGNHEELLAQGGWYAGTYQRQQLSKDIEAQS